MSSYSLTSSSGAEQSDSNQQTIQGLCTGNVNDVMLYEAPPSYSESIESTSSSRDTYIYRESHMSHIGPQNIQRAAIFYNSNDIVQFGTQSDISLIKTSDKSEKCGIYAITKSETNVESEGQQRTLTIYKVRNRANMYVIVAIVVSAFCFFPTGFCALSLALNAKSTSKRGEDDVAYKMLRHSRRLSVLSLLIGLFVIPGICCLILFVFIV